MYVYSISTFGGIYFLQISSYDICNLACVILIRQQIALLNDSDENLMDTEL